MKASTVLASLLFGSIAAAAPVNKRDLVYKTEIVTETVIVYTTVYDDGAPAATPSASPSSAPAAFYEQQKPTSSSAPAAAAPTAPAAPAYTPPVVEQPKPSPSPSPAPAPKPEEPAPAPEQPKPEQPKPEEPKPEPSQAPAPAPAPEPAYTPAPAPSPSPEPKPEPAPAPAPSTSNKGVSGASYSDVDITVYDNTGAAGACGKSLTDDMMVVAISKGLWDAKGGSTYDYMTGESSNPWCGTEIEIDYNGASVKATIMDLCPGCNGPNDVDLSRAAWKALGINEDTRLKASWSTV